MVREELRKEIRKLVEQAENQEKVISYSEFSKTKLAEETALFEEEVEYYTEKYMENTKYDIGDIVFVRNYIYKNGQKGSNHFFVIIDGRQAIDFNYFGFLLSSNINKVSFPYNEMIQKNEQNGLRKDSIVKCDDFIKIEEREIVFKIGSVEEKEIEKFIRKYKEYLERKI